MSVIQIEDLVSYQLRANYLTEVADGVGERLITLNENFLSSERFKTAGWRANPSLIKRTHSPPIPTAVASEYFQAPRRVGLTLEDEPEEGGMLTGRGQDTLGPGLATKRRRRREQMEQEDSSDLSDESDEETERAAQQIKFAKMPVRNRSGSSPLQSSTLRQATSASSPRPPPRRGSQSALETVKERARRDTVTSSEVSSENELEIGGGYQRHRDAARAAAKTVRIQTSFNKTDPAVGIKRQQSDLLEEEEEDSDASDMSSAFNESIESTSILVGDIEQQPMTAMSPNHQVVGTPPRDFKRQSTIRKSMLPPPTQMVGALPPRRPTSTIRPLSMVAPKSLISEALNAKKTQSATPFESFATLNGKGESNPLMIRIYTPYCDTPRKPYEVLIRRGVRDDNGFDRPVNVSDLIGLALWRYNEEQLEPALPKDKLNLNWWTLKMVEEGGEVDDDFPPLERTKPVAQFVTASKNKNASAQPAAAMPRMGRGRANTKIYDDFALVPASEDEFESNKAATPQFSDETVAEVVEEAPVQLNAIPEAEELAPSISAFTGAKMRYNPILYTIYHRPDGNFADMPRPQVSTNNTARGQHKLLRIHFMTPDVPPGQMVTVDATTDMYIEEVLELVCRKRNFDKNSHMLKIPNSGAVALLDRPVSAIGAMQDLELHRRRFNEPVLSQSPSGYSPGGRALFSEMSMGGKKSSKTKGMHPLAKESLAQDELSRNSNYRRFTVWRKQTMRFAGLNERVFVIDGEYIHIMPSSNGKIVTDSSSKTTIVHFSNVIGCKLSRRHPSHFKFVIYRDNESKRYDFEAKNADEATEVVTTVKQGIPAHL